MAFGSDTTTDISGSDAPTFHPFPRLPAEIRDMIWLFSIRGPRFIKVCPSPVNSSLSGATSDIDLSARFPAFFADDGAVSPSLLTVCHRSREIALRFFVMCPYVIVDAAAVLEYRQEPLAFYSLAGFQRLWEATLPQSTIYQPLWFQPAIDTIFLSDDDWPNESSIFWETTAATSWLRNIRSLAVDVGCWNWYCEDIERIWTCPLHVEDSMWGALEELVVVTRSDQKTCRSQWRKSSKVMPTLKFIKKTKLCESDRWEILPGPT
jgi:hypothetical protein